MYKNFPSRDRAESIGAPPGLAATAFSKVRLPLASIEYEESVPTAGIGNQRVFTISRHRDPARRFLSVRNGATDDVEHVRSRELVGGHRSRCFRDDCIAVVAEADTEWTVTG